MTTSTRSHQFFSTDHSFALKSGLDMAGAILFEQAQAIFSLGDIVHCTTCFNQTLEGEMMAFDPKTKMIILSILLQEELRLD